MSKLEVQSIEAWLNARAPERPAQGRFAQGSTIGEWRIEAYLGRGCSAEVYRVINIRTGREGALKLLVSEDLGICQRFVVEKDTIRFLQSGAFPTFYDDGVCGGKPYYVMEYLQPFVFPLPRKAIPRFMVAVAKSVQRLHTAGYVHRDLKPSNILCRRNGQPVLIDPGLVKRMDAGDGNTRPSALTLVNGRALAVGTIGYAAPEQMLQGVASTRSDVFSLGKVLAACFGEDHKPRGAWLDIIRRATQESPDDRYASADDFARAIRRRHLPLLFRTLTVLVFLGLVAALVVMNWPKPPPPPLPTEPPPPVVESLSKLPDETEEEHLLRLLPLAENGNVSVQLLVAEAYYYGRGTATNLEEAVKWYTKAAATENSDAQASLGLCYLYGYGCKKNPDLAVELFLNAAEADNVVAMTNLAFCYLNGRGVERDDTAAADWAREAAVRGHAPGQVLMAECLLLGRGVPRDSAAAETWLKSAAHQGNKRAKLLLETLHAEDVKLENTPPSTPSPAPEAVQ